MTGLSKRFSGGRKKATVGKIDNHSAIDHPIRMMNTLLDIDCLAQYEPSI